MKPPTYTLDPVEFVRSAEAFISDNPTEVNGLPTINLLLFHDIAGGNPHYCWHSTHDTNYTVKEIVLHDMFEVRWLPIGCVNLRFEQGEDARIHLAPVSTYFIIPPMLERQPAEEILNSTVPYFMHEVFGHELEDVKVQEPRPTYSNVKVRYDVN
jgi:hypothetical protein